MEKKSCPCCKVAGILTVIGALNCAVIGLVHVNYIEKIFSLVHLAKVMSVLIGVAALVVLASYFMTACPACKK